MSESINKSENNLENNLNDLQINDKSVDHLMQSIDAKNSESNESNEDRSDYESCEESSDLGPNWDSIGSEVQSEDMIELSAEEREGRRMESIELKSEGNQYFREGLYEKSIEFYTKALDLCPDQFTSERAVMYGNRSAAHRHCERSEEALIDANAAIDLEPKYVKAVLRRAQIYRQMNEKLDDSLKDYERVLELDPKCTEAVVESNRLKVEINERNERLKTEMMSKLKDLGNLVLRPFGLSTDNFKMSENPETGGYSVNFQNN